MSASFTIREARAGDVPALARLHVTTFNETHSPGPGKGPSYELREQQWRQMFEKADGTWFCYLLVDNLGGLVGFAKGARYSHGDQPDFDGLLDKIYILRGVQRQGLGRRLLGQVARRFVSEGISSMLLFGDARNPSNRFYEAMGAQKLVEANGEFNGGYGWRDLRSLVSKCRED
jgi:ribosomal protein S18 acetylase RimI-like enzyme